MNPLERLFAENAAKIAASGRVSKDSTSGDFKSCLCCEYRNPHRHPWSRMLNTWLFHCEKHDIVIDDDGICPCFKSAFDKQSKAAVTTTDDNSGCLSMLGLIVVVAVSVLLMLGY